MDGSAAPRWLADEMLGRLARYLRFFGHDVEYVRGLEDRRISERAHAEARVLLTRDRLLAARTPGSILLRSSDLGEQLREVRAARPGANYLPVFDRCPECNSPLDRWVPPSVGPWPSELPSERVRDGLAVFECPGCQRRFWDGSHADRIRLQVRGWLGGNGRR